jgi:tRNA dimethylallyltransferase
VELKRKKLIVIMGPTAVGKTAVSIQLAKHFHTEIISADSRQVYRELTLGTAKPTAEQLKEVKHHLIDSHSISEEYNAAQFAKDAEAIILRLFERHDYLLVCGGSGLYVRALLEGLDDIPEVPEGIRNEIINQYETNGLDWLQQEMKRLDPEYFQMIDQRNPARLIRALEVVKATGKSISAFQKRQKRENPYQVIKIGLDLERLFLYQRIDDRMDHMIQQGLFEEARALYPYRQHNALQTVGYQEIFGYLEGHYNREEAIRLLKRNSRRYAKRQLTWFRRDTEIQWFNPSVLQEMIKLINES